MFENLRMTLQYWPIEKLLPYARNPRKNDHAVEKGASWIKEFGFRVPILAKSDGSISDGHLRLKCAQRLQMKEVPVLLTDDMTDIQIKAFRLTVNQFAELADWDMDQKKLELEELKELDYDVCKLDFDGIKNKKEDKKKNNYTQKIKIPLYEPKGDKPDLKELTDMTKTIELTTQIEAADIPSDIKEFLIKAANRHTVFSYEKIAEYYCHAPKEIQELMENSALVIIDFNKGIEEGFVNLSSELAETFENDKK